MERPDVNAVKARTDLYDIFLKNDNDNNVYCHLFYVYADKLRESCWPIDFYCYEETNPTMRPRNTSTLAIDGLQIKMTTIGRAWRAFKTTEEQN